MKKILQFKCQNNNYIVGYNKQGEGYSISDFISSITLSTDLKIRQIVFPKSMRAGHPQAAGWP